MLCICKEDDLFPEECPKSCLVRWACENTVEESQQEELG